MHGASAAAKSFDPRSMLGTVCWLRSDLSVEVDGSENVSAWRNQVTGVSGDATQSTAGNRPSYAGGGLNGQPRITYAAGKGLEWALSLSGAMSVMMVYQLSSKPTAGSGEFGMYAIQNGSTFSVCDRLNALASYDDRNWLFNYSAAANAVGTNIAVALTPEVDIVTYNGGAISTPGSYTDDLNGTPETIGAVASFGLAPSIALGSLGCYVNASHGISASMVGDLYELIVANRAWTAQEKIDLYGYAKGLYNI